MEVFTISEINFAAAMLLRWASLPLFWLDPSLRIRTGCPDEVTAGIAVVDMIDYIGIQPHIVYKFSRAPRL
jgi:hypothetical protein